MEMALIVTSAVSGTFSVLRRLISQQSHLGHGPVSFDAIARGDTLQICWWTLFLQKTKTHYATSQ